MRVNDDSEFVTGGWIDIGVSALKDYVPSNVGVVGPLCNEGNTAILTHDMVHRTHLDIFDNYYPRAFPNWWLDDWITHVYMPNNSRVLKNWQIKHHVNMHGTRYNVKHLYKHMLPTELKKGKQKILNYIESHENPLQARQYETWNPSSQSWFSGLFPHGQQPIGTYGKGVASTRVVSEFLKYATPWISCGGLQELHFGAPVPSRSVFVVDVVMIAYDIDVLEIRLYEHAPYVDMFIVVESTTTQRGTPKPLFFERFQRRFASIAERIIYEVIEGKQYNHSGLTERKDEWLNEDAPRQHGLNTVRNYLGSKPLVVLSGDVDEFWSRETLASLTQGPVKGVVSPAEMYGYSNGVYARANGPYQARRGAIPLAWSLSQEQPPIHASSSFHPGVGFNMGSTFSPIAWMCKELSVTEGGGISWAHSDAQRRVQHPWVDFDKYRVGIRPCCKNDRALPKRSEADTSPIPHLLIDEPNRFPYLMGSARECNASQIAPGRFPEACTASKKLFGLCLTSKM